MTSLVGKTAVIAGGATNLGGLISAQFAAAGVGVAVHYTGAATEAAADKSVDAARRAGVGAIKIRGDLTQPANTVALFDAAVDAFGKVDIAINTVGMVLRKPILETTEAEYDSLFDSNAKAAYFFLQEAGKRLDRGGSVTTIVTSSPAAFADGYSTYAGARSPLEHFTCGAAKEFAARQINVNNIVPRLMDAPCCHGHESQATGERRTPIQDIAPLAVFLAGEGHWITGQTMFANSGHTTG